MNDADLVQLVRSEIHEHLSVLLSGLAMVAASVIGAASISFQVNNLIVLYPACFVGVLAIIVLGCMYYRVTDPRRELIDNIIHPNPNKPVNVQIQYCTIRQHHDKYPILGQKLGRKPLLIVPVIVFISVILPTLLLLLVLSLVDGSSPSSFENAKYKVSVDEVVYLTDTYDIKEGAVITEDWFSEDGLRSNTTLVILGGTVTIQENDSK